MTPRALFETELPLVREVTRFVCRRHGLSPEDAEEFTSSVLVKLIDDDYAVFRKYEARSSLRTYLTIVIDRYSIDYLIAKNGKWRPSVQSVQLGPWAVKLDRLVNRDGYTRHEAVQTVLSADPSGLTEDRVLDAVQRIPARPRRVFESREDDALPARGDVAADRLVRESECAEAAARVRKVLNDALEELDAEERVIARLRFVEGWAPSRIASALHRDPKGIYRSVERLKKILRKRFCEAGIEHPLDLSES